VELVAVYLYCNQRGGNVAEPQKQVTMNFGSLISFYLKDQNLRTAASAAESRFGDAEYNLHSCGLYTIEELISEARDEASEVAATFEYNAREWASDGLPSQVEHKYRMDFINLALKRVHESAFLALEGIAESIIENQTQD
jgi:hypothetical protein